MYYFIFDQRDITWKPKSFAVLLFSYVFFWALTASIFFSFCYQDISCIKDLTLLYENATIEDVYVAYEQLKIDENSLYSCIGIAGAQAGEDVSGKIMDFWMWFELL